MRCNRAVAEENLFLRHGLHFGQLSDHKSVITGDFNRMALNFTKRKGQREILRPNYFNNKYKVSGLYLEVRANPKKIL